MLHPDFSELEDEFSEVIDFLNEGRPEAPTERPSEMVWAAIADSLTVSSGPAADAGDTTESAVDAEDEAATATPFGNVNGSGGSPGQTSTDEQSNVRPFKRPVTSGDSSGARSPMAKRFAVMTAVAAAVLLVAVPIALSLRGDSLDQRAELLALGQSTGLGTAELTDRTLAVDLEGLEPLEGADYELWLLDLEGEELQDLVSLGTVNEDGSFTVPDGIDLDEFSVVDVSVEPHDGDESHSGNSVLRGPLSDA